MSTIKKLVKNKVTSFFLGGFDGEIVNDESAQKQGETWH